jgi:predicted Zn-dependent protease
MLLRIAPRRKMSKLTAAATAVALALAPLAAQAQERGPPVIRDTESEQLLREYTRPILRAAGLEKQNIQMVIINESVFNAFVADGRRIFVNYGAMMQSETPNQIIGVLAHETGHLAGGHLAKMREQMAQAQTQMIIAMLLGAGAMVAGSRGGNSNSGLANAGAAAVAGPQEMIRRTLISYVRQQEENADRAGVKFLSATGQSAKGMYETFKRFTNESLFAAHGADPYVQSHPMPAERVAALEEIARSSPYWDKKDDAPRHGARQDFRFHGAAGHRLPALSDVERQPARTLRARHRHLSARRPAQCTCPDRRADPGAARQPLFL